MFDFFKRKYIHSFYLPPEMYDKLTEINKKQLGEFLLTKIDFYKINLKKISDKLYYINIYFLSENELKRFKTFLLSFKELFPPWIAFPSMFQGSPRWNQGYQEHYCNNYWIPFWKELTALQKEDYMIKYNCPADWKEWLIENENNI